MKITEVDNQTIFVSEDKLLSHMIAMRDRTGWVSIGSLGLGNSVILDDVEWPAFVDFVNNINAKVLSSHESV